MDIIVLNDGIYQLIPVSKQILDGIALTSEISCLDLCDILRLKLTGYVDSINIQAPGIKKTILCGTKVGAQISDQD